MQRDPAIGKPVQDIILGSVVLFEIIGPLFIRKSLIETGEVPIAQAIHHTTHTPTEQLRNVVDRFRAAIQGNAQPMLSGSSVAISDLVRKTKGIHQSANLDQVVDHIEHSHDNTYPVVDDKMSVVGVIRYPLLSDVIFDHNASQLVRAQDLISETSVLLHPEELRSSQQDVHSLIIFQLGLHQK